MYSRVEIAQLEEQYFYKSLGHGLNRGPRLQTPSLGPPCRGLTPFIVQSIFARILLAVGICAANLAGQDSIRANELIPPSLAPDCRISS